MISSSATGTIFIASFPSAFRRRRLGAEFEIPGIDAPVNIKIPEGTQSGKELRVRGRGVPFLNEKGNGDLIAKVVVQIPRKLNRAQRELVTKPGSRLFMSLYLARLVLLATSTNGKRANTSSLEPITSNRRRRRHEQGSSRFSHLAPQVGEQAVVGALADRTGVERG